MRVLYNVQVSNFTIGPYGPKWLIKNDACVNIMRGIVRAILDKYNDIDFVIKLPLNKDCIDCVDYRELFEEKYLKKIIFFLDTSLPINQTTSRFNFNFNYYYANKELLETIDICINDENTLTKNWRVFFNHIGKNIPIISTNYYLDSPVAVKVPNKIRYYERQMESFLNSDIAAFQCEAGYKEAMEALKIYFKDSIVNEVKSSIWGIGASFAEINEYKSKKKNPPIVYFGNRITENSGRYTNWHKFAEAIGLIYKKNLYNGEFLAFMLNPTHKVSIAQNEEIKSLSQDKVILIDNDFEFSRIDYLKFINEASISVNLFVNEVHGGVTHAEALLAGNIVVCPPVNNYYKKFGPKYKYYCSLDENDSIDSLSLAKTIVRALEQFNNEISDDLRIIGYNHESYEKAAEIIYNDLNKLCQIKS